jgi:hypothetical protein
VNFHHQPEIRPYTPTYRELCDIAGWPSVTNEGIKALLKAVPRQKISYCFLELRHYWTDPFDTERAFFSKRAAEMCAEWIARKAPSTKTRIYSTELALDPNGEITLGGWEWSDQYLDYLNGKDKYGWVETLKYLVGSNGIEPNFEAEAAAETERDNKL